MSIGLAGEGGGLGRGGAAGIVDGEGGGGGGCEWEGWRGRVGFSGY